MHNFNCVCKQSSVLYQTKTTFDALGSQGWVLPVQSNPVYTDTEGAIESVRINGVSVLTGWNLEKCEGFLSPGAKQTVCNNEVSILCGVLPLHVLSFVPFFVRR